MMKSLGASAALILMPLQSAHALVAQVPEPSIFGLFGAGAIAGVLIWRAKRKR